MLRALVRVNELRAALFVVAGRLTVAPSAATPVEDHRLLAAKAELLRHEQEAVELLALFTRDRVRERRDRLRHVRRRELTLELVERPLGGAIVLRPCEQRPQGVGGHLGQECVDLRHVQETVDTYGRWLPANRPRRARLPGPRQPGVRVTTFVTNQEESPE
jgi:hypothetical protein